VPLGPGLDGLGGCVRPCSPLCHGHHEVKLAVLVFGTVALAICSPPFAMLPGATLHVQHKINAVKAIISTRANMVRFPMLARQRRSDRLRPPSSFHMPSGQQSSGFMYQFSTRLLLHTHVYHHKQVTIQQRLP
jgi:hypothetical protein